GLVNAGSLRAGATLYQYDAVAFPQMPRFAPEHFATARVRDRSRTKRFTKGIAALDHEGVVQVLMSDLRGEQTPVLAAVGPLQFEVAAHRMESDFNAEIVLDSLPYRLARRVKPSHAAEVAAYPQVEVFERSDGVLLALFADKWRLQRVERDLPDAGLEPLVG
ncbi:MAG: peptide chain release factor 3, partial [Actinomycetes bacterium]